MAKYGNNGSCYWKIIETKEDAMNTWQGQNNKDYVSKSIDGGLALLINKNGGYHCARVSELTDVHESVVFPNISARINALLLNEKKSCQKGNKGIDAGISTLNTVDFLLSTNK